MYNNPKLLILAFNDGAIYCQFTSKCGEIEKNLISVW